MTGFSLSDWDDVGELVEHALELPAAERDAYLRDAAGWDPDRLTRARRVLAAADAAGSFLDRPAADLVADLVSDSAGADADAAVDGDPQPRTIGPYRVIRLIGRGGHPYAYFSISQGMITRKRKLIGNEYATCGHCNSSSCVL